MKRIRIFKSPELEVSDINHCLQYILSADQPLCFSSQHPGAMKAIQYIGSDTVLLKPSKS